ncbi:MAG: hypothetical protein ACJ741_04180 [Pyrinomonadaceae bacterium]
MPNVVAVSVAQFISQLGEVSDIARKLQTTPASQASAADLAATTTQLIALTQQLRDQNDWNKWFDNVHDDANDLLKKLTAGQLNPTDAANAVNKVESHFVATTLPAPAAKPVVPDATASTSLTAASPPTSSAPKVDHIDLREFFYNVSSSLIDAQSALNRSSLQYVSTLDPRFPPAYYGIPAVKAEMRLGFQEVKEKGVNLILIKDSTTKSNYAESTISFEVVGTPPPPGRASYGEYAVPIPRFLVVEPKRAALLERLRIENGLADKYQTTEPYATVLRYEGRQDSPPQPGGIIPPNDDVTRYLVVWPGLPKKDMLPLPHTEWTEISILYVEEDATGKLTLPLKEEPPVTDPSKFKFPPDRGVSIFEVPPKGGAYADGVFTIPFSTVASLKKNLTPDQMATMIVDLGDALLNFFLLFHQWLEDVRYQPR